MAASSSETPEAEAANGAATRAAAETGAPKMMLRRVLSAAAPEASAQRRVTFIASTEYKLLLEMRWSRVRLLLVGSV